MRANATSLLVIGAGTVAALALRSRNARAAAARTRVGPPVTVAPAGPPGSWVWPVPGIVIDRHPVAPTITSGWGSPRRKLDGTPRKHRGADIMFRVPERKRAFVPEGTLALAASAGRVQWAGPDARGLGVTIDHGNGWGTYYTHLERLDVAKGQSVEAGTPIGVIGRDPHDSEAVRHLHFELRRGGRSAGAVDPAPFLKAWGVVWLPPLRNGGFVYRPIGDRGEPYPEWVRALKGESGVYVIREAGNIVYVGESHSGRLHETLTRHFQAWRRWKGFWRGQFGEGHDPGLTYERGSVDVAVRVTSPDDAIDEEARLIRRLRPRDNLLGQPVEEAVPF